MTLSCSQITLSYDEQPVLQAIDLTFKPGCCTALLGRNGSGKSTLLKSFAGVLLPQAGQIMLNEKPLAHWHPKQRAKQLAYLPQHPDAPGWMTVRELVAFGRYPHQDWFGAESHDDQQAIAHALESTQLVDLQDKPLGELSGGQQQRAWIAQVLAQEASIILLDEPCNNLDICYQIDLLTFLRDHNLNQNVTLVVVLHDLNHAFNFTDEVVVLHDRAVAVHGPPNTSLTQDNIRTFFHIDNAVEQLHGGTYCIPLTKKDNNHATADH